MAQNGDFLVLLSHMQGKWSEQAFADCFLYLGLPREKGLTPKESSVVWTVEGANGPNQ